MYNGSDNARSRNKTKMRGQKQKLWCSAKHTDLDHLFSKEIKGTPLNKMIETSLLPTE